MKGASASFYLPYLIISSTDSCSFNMIAVLSSAQQADDETMNKYRRAQASSYINIEEVARLLRAYTRCESFE